MRDIGEPLSRDQVDRRAVEAGAARDALFGVAFFTGVVLVNGVLAILFIAPHAGLGAMGPGGGRSHLARGDRRSAIEPARAHAPDLDPRPLTADLPPQPVDRLLAPFREFSAREASGGVLLMGAALIALVWANSPFADCYVSLWRTPLTIRVGDGFTMSLFVGDLAYGESPPLALAKIGILAASVIAGAIGYLILRSVTSSR